MVQKDSISAQNVQIIFNAQEDIRILDASVLLTLGFLLL